MQVAGPSSRGRLRTKGGETWVLQRGRVPPSLGVERLECQMEQAGEPGLLQRAVGAQCEFRGPTKRDGWTAPFLPSLMAWRVPPRPTTHTPLHWPEEERGLRLHGAEQPGPGSLWVSGVDVLGQGLKKGCVFIPTSPDVGSPQLPQRARGGL